MDFSQIMGQVANASNMLGGGGQMFGKAEGGGLDLSQMLPMGGALGIDQEQLMQLLGGTLGGQLMQQMSPLQGLLGVLMGGQQQQQPQGQQGAQIDPQAGIDPSQQAPATGEPPRQAGAFQGDGMRRDYGNNYAQAQQRAELARSGDLDALTELLIMQG
jgi:hypothetical protein